MNPPRGESQSKSYQRLVNLLAALLLFAAFYLLDILAELLRRHFPDLKTTWFLLGYPASICLFAAWDRLVEALRAK